MTKRKSLRGDDIAAQILGESPGYQHLKLTGSRLPTYNQVLLCLLANTNKLLLELIGKKKIADR